MRIETVVTFYLQVLFRYVIVMSVIAVILSLSTATAYFIVHNSLLPIVLPIITLVFWNTLTPKSETSVQVIFGHKTLLWLFTFNFALWCVAGTIQLNVKTFDYELYPALNLYFFMGLIEITIFYLCVAITPSETANRFWKKIETTLGHRYFTRTSYVLGVFWIIMLASIIYSENFKDHSEFERNSAAYDRAYDKVKIAEEKYAAEKCVEMPPHERYSLGEELRKKELGEK